MKDKVTDIETDNELAAKIGEQLVDFFNCRESFDSEEDNKRFVTPTGTKTYRGLALTVLRILRNEY